MSQQKLKTKSILLISFLFILIDQITKECARQNLERGISTVFIPGILNFRLVSNTGAAFSLLPQMTTFLGLVSLIVAIILLLWMKVSH